MKVNLITPPLPPRPDVVLQITLTHDEALRLREILGPSGTAAVDAYLNAAAPGSMTRTTPLRELRSFMDGFQYQLYSKLDDAVSTP